MARAELLALRVLAERLENAADHPTAVKYQ